MPYELLLIGVVLPDAHGGGTPYLAVISLDDIVDTLVAQLFAVLEEFCSALLPLVEIETTVCAHGNVAVIEFTDGETPCFLWNASVGIRLRTAKDCVLKISAPSGYMITSMKFIANSLNATVDSGELNSRDWTGNANTVTMTCNGACTIQSITAVMQRNADDRHLVAATR